MSCWCSSLWLPWRRSSSATDLPIARSSDAPEGATGTAGAQVDVDSARDAGAKVGETVAEGANQVQRAAADAALTAKIKSKMALDDTIEARNIDVDTTNGVVTLNGFVRDAQAPRPCPSARARNRRRHVGGRSSGDSLNQVRAGPRALCRTPGLALQCVRLPGSGPRRATMRVRVRA